MSDNLASALLAFQADPPHIALDSTNPHFKNRYASLAGIVDAIRPALTKHGLVIAQQPSVVYAPDGARSALKTTLLHAASGEKIEDVMLLEAQGSGPQAQGSALTYARRYSLLAILNLVGEEDDDANAAQAPFQAPVTAPKPPQAPPPTQPSPGIPGSAGEFVVGFGKHSGRMLRDIPTDYVGWLAQKMEAKNAAQQGTALAAQAWLEEVAQLDVPFG